MAMVFIFRETHTLECTLKEGCPDGLAKLVINEGDKEWKCTAFLISDKILATNRHCLPEKVLRGESKDCKDNIRILFLGEEVQCKSVLKFSKGYTKENVVNLDYAFLELQKETKREPFPISHQGIKENERLTFWRVDGQIESKIRKDYCTSVYKALLYPFTNRHDFPVMTLKDCSAEHGNSGSPLLNFEGEVVAILEGMNHEKATDFFKEKFGIQKIQNVMKSSNFSCINVPFEDDFSLPSICTIPRTEDEFLTEGNKILQVAANNLLSNEEATHYSLLFREAVVFDPDYSPLKLRKNHLRISPAPQCYKNIDSVLESSHDIPSSSKQIYTKKILVGEIDLCQVEFLFTDYLETAVIEKNVCRESVAYFLFHPPVTKKSSMAYYYVLMDKQGNLLATKEGLLPRCL